jgi:small nuclear ribonucleoprotein (snRNP)-like protein
MLVLRNVMVHVPPYRVHVSLHDGQLLWGTFVAFDLAMNPVIRDRIELFYPPASVHHQEGHHNQAICVPQCRDCLYDDRGLAVSTTHARCQHGHH